MSRDLASALAEAKSAIEETDSLVRVVLSGARRNSTPPAVRIDIRPVKIKDVVHLQVAQNDGRQTRTKNWLPKDLKVNELLESGFANFLIEQTQGTLSIRVTKKDQALVRRETRTNERRLEHDQTKNRLLDPTDPFLREVGIADSSGQIKPSRQDKYRQVEEFLRLLVPALNSAFDAGHIHRPTVENPLRIVDLGCGNAYLTFGAHQYLWSNGIPAKVIGIDMRVESRERNAAIAAKLDIESTVEFRAEEISRARVDAVDVVIALHACDTATDDSLEWAVKNNAKLILVAPCCHHDLQTQLVTSPEPWQIISRHGLLQERFADLLTDALRAHILKLRGYRTEVIEFVGGEHTPRNLMIRAVKTGASPDAEDVRRYEEMIRHWGIKPALAQRLLD